MVEWGNLRRGLTTICSPPRNTGGNMMDAGSVVGGNSHTNTIMIYAEDRQGYFEAHPGKVPKENCIEA